MHIGHLRICVECLENAGLDRIELIPCFLPPHKDNQGLLSFELRQKMLEQAVQHVPGIKINSLEKKRQGPSYTWDTLKRMSEQEPDSELFFILGDNDLLTMDQWYQGRNIPGLSNLLVVERQQDLTSIARFIDHFWGFERISPEKWDTGRNTRISYLKIPRLEISSSLIRARWTAGRNVRWLVPEEVEAVLRDCSDQCLEAWTKEKAGP